MLPSGGFDLNAWTASDSSSNINEAVSGDNTELGGVLVTATAPCSPEAGGETLGSTSSTSGALPRDGDWYCEGCRNINFAKRTRCNKCSAPRPKGGNDIVGGGIISAFGTSTGPPGLFKKGDWPCTHCGNMNWARRSACNICNAPKPSLNEAPRTGRGGGHYDIQDPKDRLLHDSDEEDFDEFGRRKRKKPLATAVITKSSDEAGTKPQATPNDDRAIVFKQTREPGGACSLDAQDGVALRGCAPHVPMFISAPGDKFAAASTSGSAAAALTTGDGGIKFYFPLPPLCYVKGRTLSMSSQSSHTSDYTSNYSDSEDQDP